MEHLVKHTPVQNWRRLEDYLKEARQLKAAGLSFYNSRNWVEAYTNLRAFENLMLALKHHRGSNMPQYRKELFALHQASKEVHKTIQSCVALNRNRAVQPPPLRTVALPEELLSQFIAVSMGNTERNIETVGILAGSQVGEQLVIQGLVLPPQRGQSDSCECMNDEALFNALEAHQWQAIGWIHTHPRHHLFLSAVDVHTHCNYQYFLPEAIAVVYSPLVAHHQLAIYHLSESGLRNVRNCQRTGFHAGHEEDFTEAKHVNATNQVEYRVVDLRE